MTAGTTAPTIEYSSSLPFDDRDFAELSRIADKIEARTLPLEDLPSYNLAPEQCAVIGLNLIMNSRSTTEISTTMDRHFSDAPSRRPRNFNSLSRTLEQAYSQCLLNGQLRDKERSAVLTEALHSYHGEPLRVARVLSQAAKAAVALQIGAYKRIPSLARERYSDTPIHAFSSTPKRIGFGEKLLGHTADHIRSLAAQVIYQKILRISPSLDTVLLDSHGWLDERAVDITENAKVVVTPWLRQFVVSRDAVVSPSSPDTTATYLITDGWSKKVREDILHSERILLDDMSRHFQSYYQAPSLVPRPGPKSH